jgi:hypothetical protein
VKPRDKSLDDLVARIDDARPIDWADEMRQATDEDERQLVRGLKTLSEVAAYLRDPDRQPDAPPAEPGTPWCDLTVHEAVGRGAFGTVHRAVDSVRRTVALKLLDPGRDLSALKARLLDEARLMGRIRHPNVVVVHGAGESDGRVGLWMEFIDGATLAAEVEAHGPLSADEATTIGRKLCGALIAIHGEGFVHSDVKAHNVMRERGGRIVLMDFGAGQALVDADSRRLGGTPLYLSPERLAGAPPSPASDIYALGVLLYYLVTGTYPVDGDTRADVERAHRDGVRTRLKDRRPDLPDAFVSAVEQAIAPTPADRHETAGAFDAALARVGAPAAPVLRPRRWLVPMLAVGTTAATLLGILWMVGSPAEEPPLAVKAPAPVAGATQDGYLVHAAFYQVSETGRQAKTPGTRVTPGDALELDLQLSRDASVYVINEDDQGSATLLFPLPGGSLRNPLRGGQAYTLPGPRPGRQGAEPVQWEINSFGGQEHFYVVVTPDSESGLQSAIAKLPTASDDPPPVVGGLRGSSKLAHRKVPAPVRDAPWRTLARPLAVSEETARGPWVRLLTLENPLPAR